MYVSRAVATIRDDPVPDAGVSLVLETADDADRAAVAAAAEEAGGTVERELQFGDLQVHIAQSDVDAICALDGIAAISTADAIGTHPDEAEEDVDLDGTDVDETRRE